MLDSVRASIELTKYEDRDVSPIEIRRVFEQADEQIRTALEPFGYYRGEATGKLERPEPSQYRATFRVKPGEPVIVRKSRVVVDGDGRTTRTGEGRARALPAETGRAARPRRLRAQQAGNFYGARHRRLHPCAARQASRRGCACGEQRGDRSRMEPGHALSLRPGALSPMRSFRTRSCSATRPGAKASSIRRTSSWSCNSRWSTRTTSPRSRSRRIWSTPRMRSCRSTWCSCQPNAPCTPRASTSAPTPDRAASSASTRRWLNKRGHKLSSQVQYSARLQDFRTEYRIPKPGRPNRTLSFGVGYRDEETDSSTSRMARAAATEVTDRWKGFTRTLGLQYLNGTFRNRQAGALDEPALRRRGADAQEGGRPVFPAQRLHAAVRPARRGRAGRCRKPASRSCAQRRSGCSKSAKTVA